MPYSIFYARRDNFSALMECYQAFSRVTTGPTKMQTRLGERDWNGSGNVRSIVAVFLFEVVHFFGEDAEIAAVAINYLDRFLGE